MTSPMKYTRFFMQHDRVHTALSGNAAVVCMRGQAGVLAETRLEQETARSALLAADSGDSVVGVRSQGQPEAVTYNAYGYHNPNDIPLHRPAFNGHLLLWYLYLLGNGYRAFNPVLMCFQSPDSQSPFGAGGLNCYAYCAGDPVNFSDPSGHMPTKRPIQIRSISPATQHEVLMDAIKTGLEAGGGKRRRLSSPTERRVGQEVMSTQTGRKDSGAPGQSSSQPLAITTAQSQSSPIADSAVYSVASSAGTVGAVHTVDSWTLRRDKLKAGEFEKLLGFINKSNHAIEGLSSEQTRELRRVAVEAFAVGGNVQASINRANPDLSLTQVERIRQGLRGVLDRYRRKRPG
ncbi:RHS repeat-associated core domain-containing protein [Pseudomonas asiatica]|uniref:RHS repeat-associated core domain-containing protein n=1 Tax=Pseudomonas asiatica TaxID=2219225 RepID=UPI00207B2942|nr:RHS repeat-associated core domain-containing protein [Pseudomonas asiatica]MCO8263469.1 RHS repeat-associated core domain-containing protein [Pseudomonas asiatica]